VSRRYDISVDFTLSPRIITIAAPSTTISIPDLHDTLRFLEASELGILYPPLMSIAGLVLYLLNAKIAFEARTGPDWVLCSIEDGILYAFSLTGDEMDSRLPTAFVTIDRTTGISSALIASGGGVDPVAIANEVWSDDVATTLLTQVRLTKQLAAASLAK
jgi:hypothetical protein